MVCGRWEQTEAEDGRLWLTNKLNKTLLKVDKPQPISQHNKSKHNTFKTRLVHDYGNSMNRGTTQNIARKYVEGSQEAMYIYLYS